jgi:hypothetical protein
MGNWNLDREERKRIIVILVIIMIITLSVLVFYYGSFLDPFRNPKRKFEMNYIYSDPQEFKAIQASEHLDYRTIFDSLIIEESESDYYPFYIDSEVIEHYKENYNEIDNEHKYMIYKAEALTLKDSTVEYRIEYSRNEYSYVSVNGDAEYTGVDYKPEFVFEVKSGPEKKYSFSDQNFRDNEPFVVIFDNGTFRHLNWDKGFILTDFNGFMVKMSLNYGHTFSYESSNVIGDSGSDCYQIIILDSEFSPVYIFQLDSTWSTWGNTVIRVD